MEQVWPGWWLEGELWHPLLFLALEKTAQGSRVASSDLFQQVGVQAASPLVPGE